VCETPEKLQSRADEDNGRACCVDYVLTGTLQFVQNKLRIGARLLDMHSGTSIWAEILIENSADPDPFNISVAEEIAGAVALKLSTAERKLLTRPTPRARKRTSYTCEADTTGASDRQAC
jgi:hypothetical protein